uniref:Uncharacterized protein n=1 Tax=Plectus sambesii TaxID=2011161 RepID=A0A914UK76_9BILA
MTIPLNCGRSDKAAGADVEGEERVVVVEAVEKEEEAVAAVEEEKVVAAVVAAAVAAAAAVEVVAAVAVDAAAAVAAVVAEDAVGSEGKFKFAPEEILLSMTSSRRPPTTGIGKITAMTMILVADTVVAQDMAENMAAKGVRIEKLHVPDMRGVTDNVNFGANHVGGAECSDTKAIFAASPTLPTGSETKTLSVWKGEEGF